MITTLALINYEIQKFYCQTGKVENIICIVTVFNIPNNSVKKKNIPNDFSHF